MRSVPMLAAAAVVAALIVPRSFAKLDAMYGSAKNYAAKVNQSVDRLVKERYLTESDGKKIKAELIGSPASNGTR